MDPRLLQLLQMHQAGQLPGFGQQPEMSPTGNMPAAENLASDPQQATPAKHGMFGGMSPAMLFGLSGMLSQGSMGLAPMFGLAGMGLHKLGLFK